MAIKTLRVFQEFTSEGYVPMPPAGNIDYGFTIAGTFPEETPATFQLDDPDLDVEVTEMTDFYVWIRSHGSEWNINYTRNVRVYPDSPLINNVVMGIIIANLDYTVPYIGATENVDLGEFGLSGGFVHLDNTPTTLNVPTTPGTIVWNDSDGTADLILKGGNVTLQIGQEENVRVVNKTGATLNEADFRAVRIRSVAEGGAQGQRLAVLLALADSDADSATTIGLVTETILNNQEGFITTSGNINKIDTTGAKSYGGTETWVDGDILYLSPTHAGYLTKVKPQAPNHTIIVGWVVYAHANNGKIFVKVDNGYELDELHNVKITTPLLDDFLMYDTTLNVWKNKDMHGTKGYIPYFNDTTLFLNSPFWTNGSLVGLGTITPSALLHMKGTTAYTNVILDNNSPTGGGMFSAYQNGSEVAMFGTDAYYQTNTSIDAAIAAKKAGGGIQFYTNGSQSEKMGINSDGNVFVGQTPTYTAGATQLIVRGKTGAGFLGVNHYDMSIKGFMNTFNSVFQVGTSTFHSMAFLVENSERGRVNSSGRLLWGTTTDNGTDLVQINGSLIASSIKKSGGTSSQYLMADGSVSTLGSYVPSTRTITINGTTYDLSADRTWTIATSSGTVTSVSATVPTGFAISGSPITTSGTLAITFAAGYSLPTTIKQSNWDDAYTFVSGFPSQTGNSGKYLTTNGSTLSWGTVTAGVSSFNTRTGAVTLLSSDVTTALGYTPVTNARTLTINGTAYDLSADRSWTISAGSGMRNVQTFTATSNQTTFTITGGYTAGLVDVFINGAKLSPSDFTATNGTTVVLGVGTILNDIVDIINYTASLTSGITGSGTANYHAKWSGTSAITNSLIYDDGTNVGIGTASPSEKLEISGSLRLSDGNADGPQLRLASSGFSDWNIDNISGSLRAYYGSTEYIRLTNAGNLGVGTTSPAGKLSVQLSSSVPSPTGISAWDSTVAIFGGTSTTSNALAIGYNTTANASYILSAQPTVAWRTMWFGASDYKFTVSQGTNPSMIIASNGRVGINNSSPSYAMHITGTSGTGARLLQVDGTGTAYNLMSVVNDGCQLFLAAEASTGGNIATGSLAYAGVIDTNTNTSLQFATWATVRMTILNSGNVGIGTSSPSYALHVYNTTSNARLAIEGTTNFVTTQHTNSSGSFYLGIDDSAGANFTGTGYGRFLYSAGAYPMVFITNAAERMRISSDGRLYVGGTTIYNSARFNFAYQGNATNAFSIIDTTDQTGTGYLSFHNAAGTQIGSITRNGTANSIIYNSSSDYRLKEDLRPINGLEKLSKINVYDFKWKNSDDRMDGVLAHELQEVLPYAVHGIKDGKDMQGVDYSKIVPVLVQAIKELNAKLEAK